MLDKMVRKAHYAFANNSSTRWRTVSAFEVSDLFMHVTNSKFVSVL
jgi:hypothetical protein